MEQTIPAQATVEVLLATYQGERFLREQIDSILAQDFEDMVVLAADDGSSDGTPSILAEYAERYPGRFRILLTEGPSGSAKANFLRLMQAATGRYLSFADQDDVWTPGKLSASVGAMKRLESRAGEDKPLLVFTDLRVVGEDLTERHGSLWEQQLCDPATVHSLQRIIQQNVVTGSTALINRPMLELARRMPVDAYMHDWWIAMLSAAFGAAEALAEKTVLYRQHENNVLGANVHRYNFIPRLRYHVDRLRNWRLTQGQAGALLRTYGEELAPKQRGLLEAYLRCDASSSRLERVWTMTRFGFLPLRLRPRLATLWFLWDKAEADRKEASGLERRAKA